MTECGNGAKITFSKYHDKIFRFSDNAWFLIHNICITIDDDKLILLFKEQFLIHQSRFGIV